eukprot:TRINITY_DN28065_c0_g1_i2.p1 TRINITY_DN28065_c0_g1~~TRINITY_DN28065_c0_g1_i2.p1  ORF type:complete len:415 (+),score=77.77 TRINITY_DN28065_c0_g1_i2:84-1328(+)
MIRRPPRSTLSSSSAASDVYKRQVSTQSTWGEIKRFDELGLSDELLRGIYGYGYELPSQIQSLSIQPLLLGKDTIAQAQSGTGKTGAFTIGVLQKLDPLLQETQAVLLSPTRELASQTYKVALGLSEFLGISIYLSIGGTRLFEEKQKLASIKPQVIIGTPGRFVDILKKKWISMEKLKILILDEADEMLDRNFGEQIAEIFQLVPGDVQCGLFSATLPEEILEITKKLMRDPAVILVPHQELTLEGIDQYYIPFDDENQKFDALIELYKALDIVQCIMFANTKERVKFLTDNLKTQNFVVSQMQSDMTYEERCLVMKEFRTGTTRVLICTNLLARGIDVQQVNLVINYELPKDKSLYIHRIGRAGRFGRKGVAINFISPADANFLRELEKFYHTEIKELPIDVEHLFDDLEKK